MYAKRESRTLGNVGETLIECAYSSSKGGQHGEAAPKTRARSSESGWKLWSSVNPGHGLHSQGISHTPLAIRIANSLDNGPPSR
jgi:hypothetical protein